MIAGCLAVASIAFAKANQKSFTAGICTRSGNGHRCTILTANVNAAYGIIAFTGHKAKCSTSPTAHIQLAGKICGQAFIHGLQTNG